MYIKNPMDELKLLFKKKKHAAKIAKIKSIHLSVLRKKFRHSCENSN